ncbi:MAG: hypothetical protein PHW73_04150 [Atribacterota bacterium]|nr:hypothetical protein [Atribacterota bacterium]
MDKEIGTLTKMKILSEGTLLVPRWWSFLFGGTYAQKCGGYGWRPNLFKLTYKWFKEDWYSKYSWREFVAFWEGT